MADGLRLEGATHTMAPLLLIVEDDKDVRDLLRVALKPIYRIVEAPDGLAGWEAFEREKPHLVLTDLGLPGINGVDLTERIKAHPELGDTPVIILTGATAGDELPAGFWKMGTKADAFFEKPFEPARLRVEIDRLLKARANYKPLPPGKGHY